MDHFNQGLVVNFSFCRIFVCRLTTSHHVAFLHLLLGIANTWNSFNSANLPFVIMGREMRATQTLG